MSQKHQQCLVCCAGRQTDYFSRRNPCPELHGSAVEHRSVRSTCRQWTEHVQHVEQSTLQTGFKQWAARQVNQVTLEKRKKGCRMNCDVGEATERLENELYLRHSSFSNPSVASPTSQFILQHFFRFSYVTSSSLNSPGEPPMVQTVYFLRHCRASYIGVAELHTHDLISAVVF